MPVSTDSLLCNGSTKQAVCQSDIKTAWGNFVDEVGARKGGWDWFASLTFRDKPYDARAPGWNKVGWGYSTTACDRFLREVGEQKGLHDFHWFRAREYQEWRGVPHWHLLLGGVQDLRRDGAWQWWFEKYGQGRILPYDSKLGARFYLCKYVTKELGDCEFSPNLART